MKTWTFIITFLFSIFLAFAQEEEITYKEYSYTELFEMIENETDDEFILKNTIIKPNIEKDSHFAIPIGFTTQESSDTLPKLKVNKQLLFSNVTFQSPSILEHDFFYSFFNKVEFERHVELIDINNVFINYCTFHDGLDITPDYEKDYANYDITNSRFNNQVGIYMGYPQAKYSHDYDFLQGEYSFKSGNLHFSNNSLSVKDNNQYGEYPPALVIQSDGIGIVRIDNNILDAKGTIEITSSKTDKIIISDNDFQQAIAFLTLNDLGGKDQVRIRQNTFGEYVYLDFDGLIRHHYLEWNQFKNKLVALGGNFYAGEYLGPQKSENFAVYADSLRFANSEIYDAEIALRSKLHSFYKSKLAFEGANGVYVEIKDLETKRLQSIYKKNPNFENFFTLKMNQFLALFSEYGTKPVKSIIFSFYLILVFGLIYVFFPNSWDKDGRKRLIDRYSFFFKYLLRESGLHEIYLESKKDNLRLFEEFKRQIDDSNQKVPKFFITSALNIYNWGVSGTNLSASILKRFDIIHGRWEDLPNSKKIWKTFLLAGAFITAIIYDLLIKILNALMLSVNAFTTLGFGEIPIRGIPRYLAIIQGFIGWFMLTLFSVSLISQLLN